MVSLSHFFIALLTTPLFLIFLRRWRRRHAPTSQRNPPPSPQKLPLVGNLHQIGSFPHKALHSFSRRYGPLMLLHFGRVPVLVASSAEAAREIMKTQDLTFSNRPRLSIPGRLLYNYKDVAFAPYGEYWRRTRSICVLQLLSSKRVESYRRLREEETSLMVEKITRLGSSSAVVNLSDALMSLTNDIICRVALGKKHGGGRNFSELLAEFEELIGESPLWEYISWLNWTRRFDSLDRRIERVTKAFDEFLEIVIQEHRDREEREDIDDGGFDFVDILLQFQRDNRNSSPVEDDAIKALILNMFVAGTDTSATTIEWTMVELIRNPRTMKTLQNEVIKVAGSKGKIEEEDIEKMPYLKAVIKESLRLHLPVPLLIPRESTQDTKVLGYDVASGTRVLINAWAIARDPCLWENPEEFYPERFLDTSIDYRGLNFELIPFGAGRRGCPGITFAVAIVELAIAKLVHTFDFGLPDGSREKGLDMNETSGLTIRKKNPLLVIATAHAS
ncbi:unspecific monooxygenase [Salvia divinorum]|uniref:Unspecific monooxygenase n=1 Tax=Salvia divinorum TaxID=28513 RepID=A0ABD1IKG2_SALDI